MKTLKYYFINPLLFFIFLVIGIQVSVPKGYAQIVPSGSPESASNSGTLLPSQQSLRITPSILAMQLHAGKDETYTVTIQNLLPTTIGIHANIETFFASDLDARDSARLKNNAFLSWLQISDSDFILDPQTSKTLTIHARPPTTLKDGGYYGYLFFTPLSSTNPINGSTVLSRVGVFLLGQAGTVSLRGALSAISIPTFTLPIITTDQDHVPVELVVRNRYFTHVTAKPLLTISHGKKSYTIVFQDKHVLPGLTRIWKDTIPFEKGYGLYTAHLALSIGQGHTLTKDLHVIVLPHDSERIGAVILAILVFLVLFQIRRRLRKVLRILMRNT